MNNPLQGIRDYFRPTNEVRKRDIFREFVNQGGFRPGVEATAKAIPRDMARFAISAAEAPNALRTGKANGKFYNTPFGRINSFQNEAQNRVKRGDPMWKAMGNPMMDTILGGSDLGAVAGMGARAMRGVSPLARDFTNKLGTPFQSRAMQMRPGMTTQAVGGSSRWKSSPYADMPQIIFDEPKTTGAGGSLSRITPGEMRGINMRDPKPRMGRPFQVPGDDDMARTPFQVQEELDRPFMRDVAQAIGVPPMGDIRAGRSAAIVSPTVRPDIIPKTGYGKVGSRLFQGGVNNGRSDNVAATYILDSADSGGFASPDMKQVADAIKKRSEIIFELPDEDVVSKSSVTEGMKAFLENHNYKETAPGVWHPGKENLSSWLFNKVGANRVSGDVARRTPKDYEGPMRIRFDEETGNIFVKGKDDVRSIREQDFGEIDFGDAMVAPESAPLPLSYGSKITDDFVRSWHPVGRDASKERFPKPTRGKAEHNAWGKEMEAADGIVKKMLGDKSLETIGDRLYALEEMKGQLSDNAYTRVKVMIENNLSPKK